MRLLLDAHVSGPRVGRALAAEGHDVRAIDQEPALDAIDDEDLLGLAAEEGRVLVTFNVSDFAAIAQRWAAEGRSHAGLVLVVGLRTSEFEPTLRALTSVLACFPDPEGWRDRVAFVRRRAG